MNGNGPIREALARAPWWVKLPLGLATIFGIGYQATGSWEGGLGMLLAYLAGNLVERPQDTAARVKKMKNKQLGRARVDVLAVLFVSTICLAGLWTAYRAWGANIVTRSYNLTANTPQIMGDARGRACLYVHPIAAIKCGPTGTDSTHWYPFPAAEERKFGIQYRGQFSAQVPISCLVESGSTTVHIREEGEIADPTQTPSATATATATATQTPTAT